MNKGAKVFYVEEFRGMLSDRPAVVLGAAERCKVCHEPQAGHDRRARRHAYTPEAGLSLRVTFPAERRRGLPGEVTEYPFVAEGTGANEWHA